MKKITIYEVAKEANVSLATVSRVINGSGAVKKATQERVAKAIESLGYRPNAIAQGLALSRTTTIGLIVPDNCFSQAGSIINGLCDVAKLYDYNIYLHTITEGVTSINEIVDSAIKSRVDGVVIYADKVILDDSTKLLEQYNIPMVVIGNKVSSKSICSVYIDFKEAVEELVNDYLNEGVSDIVVLEDRKNANITYQLVEGAKAAFKKHKKEFNGYIEISNSTRSTYKFLRNYFKSHKHQLVIANRDSQAFACLNAAKENGINVPEDLEIVCMSDSKFNSMVRPEISAFTIPTYDVGAIAMRLMTKILKGEQVEETEKCLNCLLQERETTK